MSSSISMQLSFFLSFFYWFLNPGDASTSASGIPVVCYPQPRPYFPPDQQSGPYFPANQQPGPTYFPANQQPGPTYLPANQQPGPTYLPANQQPGPTYFPANQQPGPAYFPANPQPKPASELAPYTMAGDRVNEDQTPDEARQEQREAEDEEGAKFEEFDLPFDFY